MEGKGICEEEALGWEEDEWEDEKAMEEREPGACVDEAERAFWRSAAVVEVKIETLSVRPGGRTRIQASQARTSYSLDLMH